MAADGYASVLLPAGNKFGYGLGSSIKLGQRIWLDIGWGQSFVPAEESTASSVYQIQIDPLTGAVSQGKVVGRGKFGLFNTIGGLGLNWTLGKDKSS